MRPKSSPNYLAGYPDTLTAQVQHLITQDLLADSLLKKYPHAHTVRTDKALYAYVVEIKNTFLRSSAHLNKVVFDSKLHITQQALGIHASKSLVSGSKLKPKREIRVATTFKEMPPEFLKMIVVHELAHFKEREHNKAFYKLCQHMEPDYHQLEFDVRVYLTYLETAEQPLWRPC